MKVHSLRLNPQLACRTPHRAFSSSVIRRQETLRIGYVPEHFSAPLHFAHAHFGLSDHATLTPFPSGTGTMIEAFAANEIDVGIGLTEAWVAGMARDHARHMKDKPDSKEPWQTFHVDGTYVESPLRWGISTGADRADVTNVKGLKGMKVGISRMGSGSHIMSTVLADQQFWLKPSSKQQPPPFEPVVCGPFADLRTAVNRSKADFFMWEHFTTKKYWDNGSLKRIGDIATPWNGWHVAVRGAEADPRLNYTLYPALARGIKYFRDEKNEAVDWICDNMEYSREDAEAWYKEVIFPNALGSSNEKGIKAAVDSLRKAGIIQSNEFQPSSVMSVSEKRLV